MSAQGPPASLPPDEDPVWERVRPWVVALTIIGTVVLVASLFGKSPPTTRKTGQAPAADAPVLSPQPQVVVPPPKQLADVLDDYRPASGTASFFYVPDVLAERIRLPGAASQRLLLRQAIRQDFNVGAEIFRAYLFEAKPIGANHNCRGCRVGLVAVLATVTAKGEAVIYGPAWVVAMGTFGELPKHRVELVGNSVVGLIFSEREATVDLWSRSVDHVVGLSAEAVFYVGAIATHSASPHAPCAVGQEVCHGWSADYEFAKEESSQKLFPVRWRVRGFIEESGVARPVHELRLLIHDGINAYKVAERKQLPLAPKLDEPLQQSGEEAAPAAPSSPPDLPPPAPVPAAVAPERTQVSDEPSLPHSPSPSAPAHSALR